MKGRTTLILLLAVIALAVFIVLVERRADTTEQRREAARYALAVRPDHITGLALVAGDLHVEATREDGGWTLTKPVAARADSGAIRRLLARLEIMPRGEVIAYEDREARGTDWDDYGLRAPRARLTLTGDGPPRTIAFGNLTPTGDAQYVRCEDRDEVVVTTTNVFGALPVEAADWRDRTLFRLDPARIQRIEVRRADGFLQLARAEGPGWIMQQPVKVRVDLPTLADWLEAVLTATVGRFVQDGVEDVTAFGLDQPAAEIALYNDQPDAPPVVLRLGRPTDDERLRYARIGAEKSVVAVDAALLDRLRVKVDDLRSRQLLPMPALIVQRVRLQRGELALELRRHADGGWMMAAPLEAPADTGQVEELLRRWGDAKIEAFIDQPGTNLTDYGLGPSSPRAAFWTVAASAPSAPAVAGAAPPTNGPPPAAVAVLGREDPEHPGLRFVQIEGEAPLFAVRAAALEPFEVRALPYRSRVMLRIEPDAVRRLGLQRGAVEQAVARDASGTFTVTKTDGVKVVPDRIRAQLEIFRRLEALRLVADDARELSAYGLDTPAAVVSAGLTGEAGIEKHLLIGGNADDGRYAMVRGQDIVFVLQDTLAAALLVDLYEKADAQPPAAPAAIPKPAAAP